MLVWIILVTENILLLFGLLIWLNRACKKCQKVKCIEQIFNQTCRTCQEKEHNVSKNKAFRPKKAEETKL